MSAATVLLFSCDMQESLDMPVNEAIVLDLSSGLTKASVKDDNPTESFVHHIDVFIFDDDSQQAGAGSYYGRYVVNNAAKLTLNANRSSFESGKPYHVYLVANSNIPESDFSAVDHYLDLAGWRRNLPAVQAWPFPCCCFSR